MILYQLGMLLLAYIAGSAVVTLIVVKVASWIAVSPKTKWVWCGLSVAFFVLLPIWDIPVAWWQFEHLCRTEAGVRIHKSVEGVEGFTGDFLGSEDTIVRYGYKFVEQKEVHSWVRYSLDGEGRVVKRRITSPTAKYRIEFEYIPLRYVTKREGAIEDVPTKERLATMISFHYRGGWVGVNPIFS